MPESKSFSKLADEWLASKKLSVNENSYYNYKLIVQRLKVFWGDTRIDEISLKMLQKFEESIETESNNTAANIKTVFNSIRLLNKSEESMSLKIHAREIVEKDFLSSEELNELRYYCLFNGSVTATAILILLCTGLRISEICALRWEDINLENRTIKVNKVLKRVFNVRVSSEKKTRLVEEEIEEREVPVSNILMYALRNKEEKYGYITSNSDEPREPRLFQMDIKGFFENFDSNITATYIRDSLIVNAIKRGMNLKFLQIIMGIRLDQVTKYYAKVDFDEINNLAEIEKL